jgi:hypothetical protein
MPDTTHGIDAEAPALHVAADFLGVEVQNCVLEEYVPLSGTCVYRRAFNYDGNLVHSRRKVKTDGFIAALNSDGEPVSVLVESRVQRTPGSADNKFHSLACSLESASTWQRMECLLLHDCPGAQAVKMEDLDRRAAALDNFHVVPHDDLLEWLQDNLRAGEFENDYLYMLGIGLVLRNEYSIWYQLRNWDKQDSFLRLRYPSREVFEAILRRRFLNEE